MKRVISLLIVLALSLSLAIPVLATDFVPSITGKGAPDIALVVDENGNKVQGEIVDANGNVIDYLTEKCLVVTPISKAETSQEIPDAAEELLLSVYKQLKDGTMKLSVEKYNQGLTADDMVIRDLFDVSWLCEEHPEIVEPAGVYVRLTFNLGISKNTDIYCMSYKHGDWQVIPTVNNGDGTVTCTFEDFCPVAFAVKSGTDTPPSQTGDDANLGLWIGLMSVSVVALAAVILFSRRKVAR